MPEKPEVITVTKKLERRLKGRKITDCRVIYEPIIDYPSSQEFSARIKGQTMHEFTTRGKWIVITLDQDYLLIHLRMEGKFFFREKGTPLEKHHHVIFTIDEEEELHFQDVRKFGRMKLIPKDKILMMPPFTELGLEPWDKHLTVEYLKEHLKKKKIPIKTALLDQSIITGIGNIYDDEILFLSRISPLKPACLLTDEELEAIIKNTVITLDKAIKEGGTTIHSFTSEEGVTGLFQNHLYVHTKEGNPCPRCGTKIIKTKVNGRGTYYCPECQKQEEERVKI
ncbi:MAG TPA: DNA-formamidopyrimidine glycosylase [Candidatus Scybalousia intestinigallinarum]|nr:DNA-formamidopyrimidine glycosylase [Candidatus Scybalousia intestinigallinarum]